jgi:hypothetical protein
MMDRAGPSREALPVEDQIEGSTMRHCVCVSGVKILFEMSFFMSA